MGNIERIDAMIKHLREMKSDLNRMKKLSDKDYR
ncbi:regulator, partial [Obesumbacterium proteus]